MKKEIIMAIIMFALGISLALSMDDYNDLVEKHNNLVEKYNNKTSEITELKIEIKDLHVSIKSYQENQTNLKKEIESQKESKETLTGKMQQKDEEYNNLMEEYWSYNNFTWTGCEDSRTVIKFCKGCNWDLTCDTISMSPTFTCENTLYFCYAKKEEIKIGDIIAFLTPEYENDKYETFYTIHRVININSEGKYITKGDGNIYIDSFKVPYKNIVGKLWRIEG